VNLRLVGTGDAALEDQLGELEDLRREGKLDLIAVSNVDQAVVERALELVDIAEIQNAYSVIDHRDDELVDFAHAHRIAFVPFGPLGSAYRRGPARLAADAEIGPVASKHGATPAQIALAWLLARSDRILLIPGTSSLSHLEENMAAAGIALAVAPGGEHGGSRHRPRRGRPRCAGPRASRRRLIKRGAWWCRSIVRLIPAATCP